MVVLASHAVGRQFQSMVILDAVLVITVPETKPPFKLGTVKALRCY